MVEANLFDEFDYNAQVTQHAHTIIEGKPVDIVTSSPIDDSIEQNGTSYGVVYENPTAPKGAVWKNRTLPDEFVSTSEYNDYLRAAIGEADYVRGVEMDDDAIETAREVMDEHVDVAWEDANYENLKAGGTDYKLVDETDRDTEVKSVEFDGEEKITGVSVGSGEFQSERVDAFEADRVMVWYSSISGQFLGRALDMNGMPFARYTDDGYLVKGLLDVPLGWRDGDEEQYDVPTTNRSKLASDLDRAPRTARPPLLRDDLEGRIFVDIHRYNGGRMFGVHVGRAMDDYADFIEAVEGDGTPSDHYDAIQMQYNPDADERLREEFDDPQDAYALFHGEGWQPEPEEINFFGEQEAEEGGSFDVETTDEEEEEETTVDHPTDAENAFAKTVAEKLEGNPSSTPEKEIFATPEGKVDLEGLVAFNREQLGEEADVEVIRELVYEKTSHLDAAEA